MNKDMLRFVTASFVIVVAWFYLQNRFAPPPDRKKDETVEAKAADKKAEPPKVDAKKPDDKTPEAKKPPRPVVPAQPLAWYTLGDDQSFLKVVVTNRGAGVRSVSLAKFKSADYLGRVDDASLELVTDDPYRPSYRLYHYDDPENGAAPTLGLGDAIWNVDDPAKAVVADGKGWSLALWALVPGAEHLKVVKTYRLNPREYHLSLRIRVEHAKDSSLGQIPFRYQLTGATGLPIEGEWYTSRQSMRNVVVGVVDSRGSLTRSFEDAHRISVKQGGEKNPAGGASIQYAGSMNQYFAAVVVVDSKQESGDWRKPRILEWARPTHETQEIRAAILKIGDNVIAYKDDKGKTHVAKILPHARDHMVRELLLGEGSLCVLQRYHTDADEPVVAWVRKGQTVQPFFDDVSVRVQSDVLKLAPGESATHDYLLYHGPAKTRLLSQFRGDQAVDLALVDRYANELGLRTLTDYHSDTSLGWFFSQIGWTDLLIACTGLMHWLLHWLHFVTFGNYGLAILLLTVVVRGVMYPISRKQAISAQKMQEHQPEMKKIQDKFKNDPRAQMKALSEYRAKHGINPAAGCLPLLMQMPVFMGLYYALQESIHFRLAPFLWIRNLAAPDMLFWWGEGIPWFNAPDTVGDMLSFGPYFNLLPGIAVTVMMIQQKLLMPPPQNEEQEMQQNVMKISMGMMAIFFYKVASGLCLYFIASSIWGIAERKLLPKKDAKPSPASGDATAATANAPAKPTYRDRRKEREKKADEPTSALGRLKEWWRKILESAEKK